MRKGCCTSLECSASTVVLCCTQQFSHGQSRPQEQLQLTSAQRRQTVRLRNEYLEAMEELMSERAALNVAIQAAAAHTEENAQVAEDHAKVRMTCILFLSPGRQYPDWYSTEAIRQCKHTHMLQWTVLLLLPSHTSWIVTRHGLSQLSIHTLCSQSLLALKQLEANMRREELLFSQLGVDFFLNVRSAVQHRCVFAPCEI